MNNLIKDCIIIDDNRDVCETLEMFCQNLGVFKNIVKAKDGSMASSKLANQSFSLILLDINMPKKSGIDVLADFKHGDIPNLIENVVIVSGELDKEKITAAMGSGVKNFLTKPFDEASFQQKVLPIIKSNIKKGA